MIARAVATVLGAAALISTGPGCGGDQEAVPTTRAAEPVEATEPPGPTVLDLLASDNRFSVPVTVDGERLTIGDATVVEADIEAVNGIVHAVGRVLVPQLVRERVLGTAGS